MSELNVGFIRGVLRNLIMALRRESRDEEEICTPWISIDKIWDGHGASSLLVNRYRCEYNGICICGHHYR